MLAFEVSVNGKRICVAGTAPINRVLGASLSWTFHRPDELIFCLGGILADDDKHFDFDVPKIGIGDEIVIRIIESEEVDEPSAYRPKKDNSNRH